MAIPLVVPQQSEFSHQRHPQRHDRAEVSSFYTIPFTIPYFAKQNKTKLVQERLNSTRTKQLTSKTQDFVHKENKQASEMRLLVSHSIP